MYMYLVCAACQFDSVEGSQATLAASIGSVYYTTKPELDEFFKRHANCGPKPFTLIYDERREEKGTLYSTGPRQP